MGKSIGGVEVVRGTSIRWAALFTVMVGGPVYAYSLGIIQGIQGFWGYLTGLVVGLGEFVASLLYEPPNVGPTGWASCISDPLGCRAGGLLGGGAAAMRASWQSFVDALTPWAGPFTWVIAVVVVMLVLTMLYTGVTRWLS